MNIELISILYQYWYLKPTGPDYWRKLGCGILLETSRCKPQKSTRGYDSYAQVTSEQKINLSALIPMLENFIMNICSYLSIKIHMFISGFDLSCFASRGLQNSLLSRPSSYVDANQNGCILYALLNRQRRRSWAPCQQCAPGELKG